MDAPIYLPASQWEEPKRLPQALSTSRSSMADFLADPAARAILKSEIRGLDALISVPQMKPHLSNLSPKQISQFGGFVTPEAVERIEAKLKALATGGASQ